MKKLSMLLISGTLLLSGCATTGKTGGDEASTDQPSQGHWNYCARWGILHPKCLFVHIQDLFDWSDAKKEE